MERMNLTLDIQANKIGSKRVNVRSSLVVSSLIATITDKFNLDGSYELRLAGASNAMPVEAPLDQVGVKEGGVVVCTRRAESTGTLEIIQRGERLRLSKKFTRVYLQEDRTETQYDLGWQPALIGRKDRRDPSKNRLLVADLEEMEELPTVSRHHACITEHAGTFYLESLQGQNPTLVGNVRLRPGLKHPLSAGAKIQVGRVALTFYMMS